MIWQSGVDDHDRGIVAATDRRLLLLNRGRFTKNVADAPYLSIWWDLQEQGQDKLTIKTPGYTCNLVLERGAVTSLSDDPPLLVHVGGHSC